MSLAAALALIAQSAAPIAADAGTIRAMHVAETVRASVRVLTPARISFATPTDHDIQAPAQTLAAQRQRDAAGTVWIEFS